MLSRLTLYRALSIICILIFLFLPLKASALGPRQMGYGLNIADLSHANAISAIGFDWMKSFLRWSGVQTSRGGAYNWADMDNIMNAAQQNGLKLLIRVDGAPGWSHPSNGSSTAPPDSGYLTDWGNFLYNMALHGRGRVQAYEIWNEPNLTWEWGNTPPNPAYYAQILRVAYDYIKAGDPNAIVVSAGMATTGGDGGVNAMDDVEFIRKMYDHGARGKFDALGSHPYGFASAPEDMNPNGVLQFRRSEAQHAVMVERGDGAKKVWATEFGWLLHPNYDGNGHCVDDWRWNGRTWQIVSAQTQADYLARAYTYAYERWPWMEVMIAFNLDFASVPWYETCEPMRYYSILNNNNTPRPAFYSLWNMSKSGRMSFPYSLSVPSAMRGYGGGW